MHKDANSSAVATSIWLAYAGINAMKERTAGGNFHVSKLIISV